MDCPDCGAETVRFAVPAEFREHVPFDADHVAFCSRCLSIHPAADGDEEPDFSPVADVFPRGKAGIPMALVLGMLDSLALHRADIEALLDAAERAGVDPFLVIDRLDAQGSVQAQADLSARRRQLEQLL